MLSFLHKNLHKKIFNLSLKAATIPPCLKSAVIIPLPQKSSVSSFDTSHRAQLTPSIRCSSVLWGWSSSISRLAFRPLDPYQLPAEVTKDATATALHTVLRSIKPKGNNLRMLFTDFCSMLSTVIPDWLVTEIMDVHSPFPTHLSDQLLLNWAPHLLRPSNHDHSPIDATNTIVC